jgi:hypothetical protein
MMEGYELLSVLIAKVLVLKPWLNLGLFEPEGRRPFRLRTTMATGVNGGIGGLDSSGEFRR